MDILFVSHNSVGDVILWNFFLVWRFKPDILDIVDQNLPSFSRIWLYHNKPASVCVEGGGVHYDCTPLVVTEGHI